MMNTGSETVKMTVDQFATAGNQAFKDGVEKSLTAINEANAQGKRNMEAVAASVSAAAKGAETLGAQAIAYSKTAFENQVAQAKALSTCKSVQEVVELQTTFAKSSMEAFIAEMNRASEIVSSTVKDSMRPLNERATAVVEQFQAAR
jgi:phasin family protein